jgi:predicted transcriptional regulator
MDFDLYFGSPRWRILEIIAREPSSPVEISLQIQTSVSYVSQQLKLLEAAGLVVKKRTGTVDKGKPRTVYSLSKELFHLTLLSNQLSAKKLIYLTEFHKTILRIWLLEDSELHYYIEKLYWKLEEDLDVIEGIFVDLSSRKPRVLVISDSKKVKPKIDSFSKDAEKKLDCQIVRNTELKKISPEFLHPIYDPIQMILGIKEKNMKGGNEKNVKQ